MSGTLKLEVVEGPCQGATVCRRGGITVGRSRHADLLLRDDSKVSALHATLAPLRGQWFIEDHGSTNGTYVNGERVEQCPLRDGDTISIGRSELVVQWVDDEEGSCPPT
ncbi:MAG: FHA domain-containing protein [Planctomycetes bacterium]|nr:FHA domain-containing protein [Planctomycetota bacterium]